MIVHTKIKIDLDLATSVASIMHGSGIAVRTWRLVLKFLTAWLSDVLESLCVPRLSFSKVF
jgi:hypothetical protein